MSRKCIAIAGPFSGSRSAYGDLIQESLEEIEIRNSVEFVLLDDQAEPELAIECAARVVKENIMIVVGHFNSSCAEAAAPIYKENNIALILPASTKENLTELDNVFRICPTNKAQIESIKNIVRLGDPRRISVYLDKSEYAKLLWSMLSHCSYDFIRPLSCDDMIRNEELEMVIAFGIHTNIANLIKNLNFLERKIKIICNDDALVDEFAEMVSSTRHEIMVIGPDLDYKECTVRALNIALDCLANSDSNDYVSKLRKRKEFYPTGEYRDAKFVLYQVMNGKFRCCS